jgi:uncharacterized membrane protein YkvI
MNKKLISIIFAYVGILTGAGLASGQELLQYFISFGTVGLIALFVVGVLHFLLGGAILQLGSHYQANSHIDVLDELSNEHISRFLDISLLLTCFVFGFVMIAGAGSNLQQEFGLKARMGSLLCTVLIIIVGMMDFDKVTKIIGSFTPLIMIFVLIATIYSLLTSDYNIEKFNAIARTIPANTSNPFLATINYFAMCIMSAISMAFVLGGSNFNSAEAAKGGLWGGLITGLIGFLVGLSLFLKIDLVKDADIPTQIIIREINPLLGRMMAIVIFGMIFNTGISLFYSMAKRFSDEDEGKFKKYLIFLSLLGFAFSFLGFKKLVAIFYPLIGYIGLVLLAVITIGRLQEKDAMKIENRRRIGIFYLTKKKEDDDEVFTKRDQKRLDTFAKNSILDDDYAKEAALEHLMEKLDEEDDGEEKTED